MARPSLPIRLGKIIFLGWLLEICSWSGTSSAQAPKEVWRCEICDGEFGVLVYKVDDPVRLERKLVCESCFKSETVCEICGLAVPPKARHPWSDGRILCAADFRGAVLSEEAARVLFAEAKREALNVLSHWLPLPEHNIEFHLVNRDLFLKEARLAGVDDSRHNLSLTVSRVDEGGEFHHIVYVQEGLLREHFQAVGAHAVTHAWLEEHGRASRQLERDTAEGFCDLVAYKVMTRYHHELEQRRLLESSLTRNQIHALLQAEERYQFYRVVAWIQNGEDGWLDPARPESLLDLHDRATPEISIGQYLPVPTAVPDVLMLKGIAGTSSKRFALINNQTFAGGEMAKVRVGQTNLAVRCLEIREASVKIRVEGEEKDRELYLTSQ